MTKRIAKKRALHGCSGNQFVAVTTDQWFAARAIIERFPKWETSRARVERLCARFERRWHSRSDWWRHAATWVGEPDVPDFDEGVP